MTRTLHPSSLLTLAAAIALTLLAGCFGTPDTQAQLPVAGPLAFQPRIPVSDPPFDTFHASWVTRLEEGYVYVDHFGSYTDTGAHIPALLREMRVQGLEASDPPFCLFYDDPATTPREQLRSRACVPIEGARSPRTPLSYDVLPSVSVAYAYVSGPYPQAPRAYPKLLEWMSEHNWVVNGPIMERYHVPPAQAKRDREFICEIQIPAAMGGR